jgi:hypothetical protein
VERCTVRNSRMLTTVTPLDCFMLTTFTPLDCQEQSIVDSIYTTQLFYGMQGSLTWHLPGS